MRKMILYLLCFFIVGCTNKPSKEKNLQTPIDNTVGVNDTFGISLRPEFPVYSTSQKRIIFKLRNNGDANIGFGGYYHYTYKDENGTWRKVPMKLVVFDEELMLFPNHEYLYDAKVFQHTPGMYRFFLSINRCGKSHTLMTEFELSSDSVLRGETSPVDSLKTQPKDSSQTVSFELKPIPREIPKEVKRIRKRIDDYWESNRKSPNDTTAYNIHSTWIEGDDEDTIYVGLMNNTPHFQEMFRRKVVSYSAVTHGIVHQDVPFFQSEPSDTLHVTMKTERPVYPVGTETISVELVNGNSHNLFFGDPYNVVRKEEEWYMGAEFRIE